MMRAMETSVKHTELGETGLNKRSAAFELKGTVATLTVLRLLSKALPQIDEQLREKIAPMPQFFDSAPVVVDVQALGEAVSDLDFLALVALLREHKLVPVAVRGIEADHVAKAAEAGLGVLRSDVARGSDRKIDKAKRKRETPAPEPADVAQAAPSAQEHPAERWTIDAGEEPCGGQIVKNPVRGGQIVYAQQRDLVLLGPVNAGAEVIADGNIHTYAALRGRALAGAHGNESARIFCSNLEAELVSIAGHYLRAEEIPSKLRGKAAQIYLEDGELKIVRW